MEIKRDKRDDLFAATPPLEAKKVLMSMAVTEKIGYLAGKRKQGMCLDFIDVSRAFFHADAIRRVYVQLPEEDAQEGMCGLLGKSMYGTRDAAQNWGQCYMTFMVNTGFTKGLASHCCFFHKARNIRCVVHGDDFTLLGARKDLDWFRERIQ